MQLKLQFRFVPSCWSSLEIELLWLSLGELLFLPYGPLSGIIVSIHVDWVPPSLENIKSLCPSWLLEWKGDIYILIMLRLVGYFVNAIWSTGPVLLIKKLYIYSYSFFQCFTKSHLLYIHFLLCLTDILWNGGENLYF